MSDEISRSKAAENCNMSSRLAGRRIVITGSGRGLGFAYAERLAREGADVIIAEIDATIGSTAEKRLREEGFRARFVQTDVASEASLEKMAAIAGEYDGGIYGLVANAGWANNVGGKLYNEIDAADWDRMMAINVRGTWLSAKAIGPRMQANGSIVTVTSATALTGAMRLLHYATSKSAIIGMTRSLAREFGDRMIRVNAISPGLTAVDATKDIPEWRWKDYDERKLLKRTQVPEDVDGVVAFLMSDDSRFITGQTIAVDGGLTFL